MIRLELPIPPTANNLFCNGRNGKGRFISLVYTQWQWAAYAALKKPVERISGPFRFRLILPVDMRGDVDNRIKPVLDFCVTHAITSDDRYAQSVSAERGDVKKGFCLVEIEVAS
jgi:Holliday junction resolvase RusA-like endonuclease